MRRSLVTTGRFARASKRLLKRHPELAIGLKSVLVQLAADAFQSSLQTHKLKGNLAGLWACSAGFDLRVVFELSVEGGEERIMLLSVGTHEDVY